jgi:hypothetical protein
MVEAMVEAIMTCVSRPIGRSARCQRGAVAGGLDATNEPMQMIATTLAGHRATSGDGDQARNLEFDLERSR